MLRLGDTAAKAGRWVRNQGFQLNDEEPDYSTPVLPTDITAVLAEELMVLFGQVNAWMDYTEVALAAARIEEKQEQQELEHIKAELQIEHKAEKTVSATKAHMLMDDEYSKQEQAALQAYARVQMIETVYNSLERKRFILSRELSRRQGG